MDDRWSAMTEHPLSSEPAAAGCGCGETVKFDGATLAYRRILMAVIAINGAAFVAIAGGAALQGSASLGANALDFLADAATYGISLAVIGRSVAVRSAAALVKGVTLVVLALFVLGYAAWRAATGAPPEGFVITGLGGLGFFANAFAALLLVRHRELWDASFMTKPGKPIPSPRLRRRRGPGPRTRCWTKTPSSVPGWSISPTTTTRSI